MAAIRPAALPSAITVANSEAVIVDDGATVRKATPAQVVNAGRPISSQAEAEAGTDNVTAMTPLRVRQAMAGGGIGSFTQVGPGAVTTTVDAKLKGPLQTVLDRGAVGDGLTDARAAFVACDALGAFAVPPGSYLITASLVISNRVVFDEGARLVIPDGTTITFASGIVAASRQIFNISGTGAVAGLAVCHITWFMGDLLNTNTDAEALVQKAYDACTSVSTGPGAIVHWPVGFFATGGVGIKANKGQHTRGAGLNQSWLRHLTPACNGIHHEDGHAPTVEDINMRSWNGNIIATSGTQVWFKGNARDGHVMNCQLNDGYIAKRWTDCNGGKSICVDAFGAQCNADWIENSPNIMISNGTNSSFSDWFIFASNSGYVIGEALSWPGGNGQFAYRVDATRALCIAFDHPPAIGDTILGSVSGFASVLTDYQPGFKAGGLRLSGNAAAAIINGNEYSGGVYALTCEGSPDAHGTRPEYCHFEGNYFDFSINGALVNVLAGSQFTGNWFCSRSNTGLTIVNAVDCDFYNNSYASSWYAGIWLRSTAKGIKLIGGFISGNNRANLGQPGILVDAGTTDFIITGMTLGRPTAVGYDGTQTYGVQILAGASDRYLIQQCLISGNSIGGVLDGGTGINKLVSNNF